MERHLIENDFTVAVTYRHNMRPVEYRCNHLELKVGDQCVVDSERGPAIVTVERTRMKAKGRCCTRQLRNVLRKATPLDLEVEKRNLAREKEIYRLGRQRIAEGELKMKLSHVEISFDEKRAILYFTSDERVDFRDMVKRLAAEMNVRIEMRQVGVRDEARILGGCGICGFKLCCSSFLPDFMPVSIRMAKDQNLSLNPTKISGVCGRLMCCLMYEQDFYKEMQKTVPRTGKTVITPEGRGKVLVADFLRSRVTVLVEGDKGVMTFEAAQVQPAFPTQQQGKRQGGQQGRPDRPPRDRDRQPDKRTDKPVDKPVEQAVQEALEENGNGDDEPAE